MNAVAEPPLVVAERVRGAEEVVAGIRLAAGDPQREGDRPW
jgi:hypothetical protein